MASMEASFFLLPAALCLMHVLLFLPARHVCRSCKRAWTCRWRIADGSAYSAKVQRLMVAKRQSAWQEFMSLYRHFMALILIMRLLLWSEGGAMRELHGTYMVVHYILVSAFICFYAGFTEDMGVACIRGRRLDAISLRLQWARQPFVAYLVIGISIEVFFVVHQALGLMDWTLALVLRNAGVVVLSVVNKRADQTVLLSSANLVANMMSSRGHVDGRQQVLQLAVFGVSGILCAFISQALQKQQAISEIEAKSSRHVELSIEQILRGVCDAVVHLTADLALMQESPQLEALLLRGRSAGSARRSQAFLDLLHGESDRERFCRLVRQPQVQAAQAGLPHTLHVAMCDANRTPVPVQIFHTEYLDAADEPVHLIGIREFGDGEALRAPQPQDLAKLPGDLAGMSRHQAPSQDSVSELSSCSGGSKVLAQVPPAAGVPDEVAVWVRPFRTGLPMFQCTPEFFAKVGGPSLQAGMRLADWVPKDRWPAVEAEIQIRFNRLVNKRDHSDDGFEVFLKPRHMARHGISAHVVLSLADGASDEDPSVAKITFHRLQLMPRRPRDAALPPQTLGRPLVAAALPLSAVPGPSTSSLVAL